MTLDRKELGRKEEIYTFADGTTKEITHFAASRIRERVETILATSVVMSPVKNELPDSIHPDVIFGWVPTDPEMASLLIENSGIEQHRLDRLTAKHCLSTVIIIVEFPDGQHALIDGNHRYVKACQLKLPEMPAAIVKPALWREFVVTGLNELADANGLSYDDRIDRMKKGYSGL